MTDYRNARLEAGATGVSGGMLALFRAVWDDWSSKMSETKQEGIFKAVIEGLSCPDSPDFVSAIELLREMQDCRQREIFEPLLEDPDARLALGIARAVGILECDGAADLLLKLVEEPGKWFGHQERSDIRLAAVHSLGNLKDCAAVDVLLELIGAGRDPELDLEIIKAISKIGTPECVLPLVEKMNANPPIALSAAGAIASIGGEEAYRGLVTGLVNENEMVQSACIWALGKMGDERAINPLMSLLDDNDEFLRRDVAWALGQIGGLRARLMLGLMCTNDPDLAVRQEASRAIRSGTVLGKSRETSPDE